MENQSASQSLQQGALEPLRAQRAGLKSDPFGNAAEQEQSDAASGLTFSLLWHSVIRRWKLAVCLGTLAALGAAGYAYSTFVPVYQASAWVQVSSRRDYLVFAENGGGVNRWELATLVELIRSPAVMDEVAAHPEIRSRNLSSGYLSYRLGIRQQNESELFQVTFDHPDAETAAVTVNTVLDVYRQVQARSARGRMQRVIELLSEDRQRRSDELARLRTRMSLLLTSHPELAELAEQGSKHVDSIQALQNRLIEAEVNQEVLTAELATDNETLTEQTAEMAALRIEETIDREPQVQALLGKLIEKETLLSEARAVSAQGDQAPLVRQLTLEIEHYRKQLAELREGLRPVIEARLEKQVQNEYLTRMAQTRGELTRLSTMHDKLEGQLATQLDQAHRFNPKVGEYRALEAEIARAEAVYQQISGRMEALQTEMAAPGRITIIRGAGVPGAPVQANPYQKMATAGICAFLLPFGLVVFLDRRGRRVIEAAQVSRDSGLSVVGEVAKLPSPSPSAKESARNAYERKIHDESIDAVCTRLLLTPELRNVQVIATASAVSGEGKTHLASHLAVSIARSFGHPTLIIDADLRSPGLAGIYDISNEQGLAEVLDGRCELKDAIITTWSPSLHILSAGKLASSPHALFRSERFEAFMREVRATYRHVVIDIPPVLAASEALIVAEAADATLVCAMRDFSRTPQVKMAYDHLAEAGAAPLGVVINGVPSRRYESRYGTYYYTAQRSDASPAAERPKTLIAATPATPDESLAASSHA